jgi:uncharacterized protein (DUF58 family)
VARTAVEGFLTGLHRSPHYGFSQEFKEYRAYVEGDDPRFVDWNVYARTERTYIRRYEGETNTRLMILLDASASMDYSSGGVSKLQYGKFLAACSRVSRSSSARSGRSHRVRRADPPVPSRPRAARQPAEHDSHDRRRDRRSWHEPRRVLSAASASI